MKYATCVMAIAPRGAGFETVECGVGGPCLTKLCIVHPKCSPGELPSKIYSVNLSCMRFDLTAMNMSVLVFLFFWVGTPCSELLGIYTVPIFSTVSCLHVHTAALLGRPKSTRSCTLTS
jgi:hypothetical protein